MKSLCVHLTFHRCTGVSLHFADTTTLHTEFERSLFHILNANLANFLPCLVYQIWPDDVNEAVTTRCTICSSIADQHAPIKRQTVKVNKTSWMTF